MFVENSRTFLSRCSGRRGLRCFSLRVGSASKVSGPGLEYLNADNARCGTPGRPDALCFGWKQRAFRGIHLRTGDC